MELKSEHIWLGIGIGIVLFLVVTTPGWKEALGVNLNSNFGKYAPLLVLLGSMGGLLGVVLLGKEEGGGES